MSQHGGETEELAGPAISHQPMRAEISLIERVHSCEPGVQGHVCLSPRFSRIIQPSTSVLCWILQSSVFILASSEASALLDSLLSSNCDPRKLAPFLQVANGRNWCHLLNPRRPTKDVVLISRNPCQIPTRSLGDSTSAPKTRDTKFSIEVVRLLSSIPPRTSNAIE